MSNPFEEDEVSESVVVLEGLLCPQCMAKFNCESDLLKHFNEHQLDTGIRKSGERTSGFKSILGRAKKIFESEDVDAGNSSGDQQLSMIDNNDYWRSVQSRGPSKSHWDGFKKKRARFMDNYVIETNKLILRLDRILKNCPTSAEKRKQHEKDTVEWVEDKYVKLCPNCAKSFNFSRRKHHCRLCGGIMCNQCSMFLEYTYAMQIISPIDLETSQLSSNVSKAMASGNDRLQRRPSIVSLPAAIPSSSNEPNIRVCCICKGLLDRRFQQMHEQHVKPYICSLYETLQKYYNESNRLLGQYYQIIDTLKSGEANYQVQHDHAEEVRSKLSIYAEMIELASRKISTLGAQGGDVTISARQKQLQSRVRISATNYLHNNLFGLPAIPSQEEIDKIIENRIREEEARKAIESSRRTPQRTNPSPGTHHREQVETDSGWTPGLKKVTNDEDIDNMNPLLIQINQIKEFIDLAKKDNRYDEATILEQNLRELEIEYLTQETTAFETS